MHTISFGIGTTASKIVGQQLCLSYKRTRRRNRGAGRHFFQALNDDSSGEAIPSLSTENSNPIKPKLTRLQREARELLSIDVEYAHFRVDPAVHDGRSVLHFPVEVCIIDIDGESVLHCYGNPLIDEETYSRVYTNIDSSTSELKQQQCEAACRQELQSRRWRNTGGIPLADWACAPPLTTITQRIREIIKGRPLVGHNLSKDLAALKISHPAALCRDTMRYAALQGSQGLGRRLSELAEKKLGVQIQTKDRHCPK